MLDRQPDHPHRQAQPQEAKAMVINHGDHRTIYLAHVGFVVDLDATPDSMSRAPRDSRDLFPVPHNLELVGFVEDLIAGHGTT